MAGWIVVGVLVAVAVLGASASAYAVTPSAAETAAARGWVAGHVEGDAKAAPYFSFVYDGRPAAEVLKSWTVKWETRDLGSGSREETVTYTDPATGLVARSVVTEYGDFPAVEWVLYLKNSGGKDTPIIENILPLDTGLALAKDKPAVIRYANGSECRLEDFAPQFTRLGPTPLDPQNLWRGEKNPVQFGSKGGRSSCGALPFFDLDMGARGVMGAIGWTGDWAASVYRTNTEVRLQAGMPRTHLKLHPGEEIRTPRILLLFWDGDRLRGHNLLRQFILAHHSPQVNGKRAQAPICFGTWGGNFVDKHIAHAKWFKDNHLPLDYLWVDAGWFGKDEAKEGATVFNSQWWRYVGDWYANPGYFPHGLKPLGEALHKMGIGFLLWLEPERVYKDTEWTREHPDYLLGPIGDNYLFNLGDPVARKMLTDHLVKLITEGLIGCYRQDFNMDPRAYWDKADAPDRVGMAEIRHITGLYAMWDELLARCPGLLIDNCSSGGRRIDLETISRSIPLWRSDIQCYPKFSPTAMQDQTQGLGMWAPLSVGVFDREDTYAFRSALGPGIILCMPAFEGDPEKHFSVAWLRTMLSQLDAVRPYFLGDFYPLVSFSTADDDWAAWQFDRPDLGEGTVLALRRPESPITAMTPALHGLVSGARYAVRDLDTNETSEHSGDELVKTGLTIEIDSKPGSRLLTYKKL